MSSTLRHTQPAPTTTTSSIQFILRCNNTRRGNHLMVMAMEKEQQSRPVLLPPAPLQQLSPDRLNQLRIPHSPSMPIHLNENGKTHLESRRDSDISIAADVRSKISHFNSVATQHVGLSHSVSTSSFAIAASPTRSPIRSHFNSPTKGYSRPNSQVLCALSSTDSEPQLAIANLQAQLTQSMNRERLVAERVESLMEQLQASHSRARHEKASYEKELKLSNKAQYKSELALIRCQEELRETRSELESAKVKADRERQEREKAKQEAFERAYVLAGVLEEVEGLKEKLRVVQSERDALMGGPGDRMEVFQRSTQDTGSQTEVVSEVKKKETSRCDCARNGEERVQPTAVREVVREVARDVVSYQFNDEWAQEELEDSRAQADWLRSQLRQEQTLVELLTVQCHFECCSSRTVEKEGKRSLDKAGHDQKRRQKERAQEHKRRPDNTLAQKYIPMTGTANSEHKGTEAVREMSTQQNYGTTSAAASSDQLSVPMLEKEPVNLATTALDLDATQEEDADPTLRLPRPKSDSSRPTTAHSDEAGVIPLSEAAAVPLPEPRSDDLEPTELLEDMTCVMIEPDAHATAKKFTFSTSVSSSRAFPAGLASATRLPQSDFEVDLFDLAPPTLEASRRSRMPARPSTSLGFATTHDSPIRVVPRSPEHLSASVQPILQHRPLSHDFASSTPVISPPGLSTRRVPLRGESPTLDRVTMNRRSQSRSRAQSRTRGRSPASTKIERGHAVTPELDKQARPRHHATHQQQTNTQSVPLKGLGDNDTFQSSSRPGSSHSSQQSSSRPHSQLSQHSHPHSRHQSQPHNHTIHITTASSQPHRQPDAFVPGTPITREAALAQIRARRDRARSLTRRKADSDDPAVMAVNKTPAKRGLMLRDKERDISSLSQLSQASAPARF